VEKRYKAEFRFYHIFLFILDWIDDASAEILAGEIVFSTFELIIYFVELHLHLDSDSSNQKKEEMER
jgi:hypothetical protein